MRHLCQLSLVLWVVLQLYAGLKSAFEPHESHGPLGFDHACMVIAFCGWVTFSLWKGGAMSELKKK